MKLKDNFISHTAGDTQITVSVDSSFHGLLRSNKTAAFIIDCLREETTKDAIADKMCEKYDAPRDVIESGIDKILSKLREIGAIDE